MRSDCLYSSSQRIDRSEPRDARQPARGLDPGGLGCPFLDRLEHRWGFRPRVRQLLFEGSPSDLDFLALHTRLLKLALRCLYTLIGRIALQFERAQALFRLGLLLAGRGELLLYFNPPRERSLQLAAKLIQRLALSMTSICVTRSASSVRCASRRTGRS